MPLGQQSTGGVDRHTTTKPGLSTLGHGAALTDRTQPQRFDVLDLTERGGVVDFSQRDVLRSYTGLLEGLQRSQSRHLLLLIVGCVNDARSKRSGQNPNRTLSVEARQRVPGADHERCRPIADGRAHRTRQRPRDDAVGQHLFNRTRRPVVRQRIHRRVPMVLRSNRCKLALRQSMLEHVVACAGGIGIHEDAAFTNIGLRFRRQGQVGGKRNAALELLLPKVQIH